MSIADQSVRIEPLAAVHARAAFSCGKESLDRYIREHATQDIRRGIASVFVAVTPERPTYILGFFTLSAASVVPAEFPPQIAKRLPKHLAPAALIGRLAVDYSVARRGLGAILLADAVQKATAAAETLAAFAVVVDPLDDDARSFYTAFGFQSLQGPQRRMFLTLPRRTL